MPLGEYLASVVALSASLGLISYLSYPTSFERMLKFASAVLIIYTAILPMANIISDISNGGIDLEFGDTGSMDDYNSEEYITVAKEAFEDGICQYLCTKYNLQKEDVTVMAHGFRFRDMAADRILVKLYGRATFADSRLIQDELTDLGLGVCEVTLGIG